MLPVPWREPDTVPLLNATPFHAFTLTWQLQPPQDAMVVVVKATFDLQQGAHATVAEEEEQLLPTGDEPFEDAASPDCLRYPSDMAFYKPACDLFLVGRAYPERTGSSPGTLVRFAVGSVAEAAIGVIGDRVWKGGVPSAPEPFDSMELRPDRAYGGLDVAANPVGVGQVAEDGMRLPNLEQPDRVIRRPGDSPPPALTTPIPTNWRARLRHAGTYDKSWVDRAPYFPPDFDWRFFNAAPEHLQVPYLRGDEPYWIQGMVRGGAMLEGRLPAIAPRVLALGVHHPDTLRELPMHLDTAWFDAEARQVVLVWRGGIASADQYGSDLAAFYVHADPLGAPSSAAALRAGYEQEYRKRYVLALEDEPEEEEEEAAPEAAPDRPPPQGLTPSMARNLGLPPSAATVHLEDDEASEPPPPPPPSEALSRAEVERLLESGEPIDDVDLSRCDLTRLDLSGRHITGCALTGARLEGAVLTGAVLAGSVLVEVDAKQVDFTGADLRGADLGEAQLEGACFRDANLTSANLSRAACGSCVFEGATLDDLMATDADFAGCRFDGATAHRADLTGSRLEGASMTGVEAEDLRLYDVFGPGLVADDAKLTGLRADNARLPGSSFQRVEAPDSSVRQADLTQSDWRKASVDETVFEDSNLERALFSQVEAKDCRWPRARAVEASFLKANLMGGYFESAVFDRADLRGANLYGADTFRASFAGADLTHAILGNTHLA